MGDLNLSLEVRAVGTDKALADVEQLSKAGQMVVERFARATNVSLDNAIAKYKSLGDKAAMEMLRIATAAEAAAAKQTAVLSNGAQQSTAAVERVTAAVEHGTRTHEPHIQGLSRIGNALASMVGHATGVPPVIERIGDALGVMAFGHLATVGVLAGFAAIAFAYEKITEKAREAAEEADRARAKIAEAANAGQTDPIREAARKLQFGQPFDKEGKLVPVSEFAPGAFEGSLADLQGKLRSLQEQFYATTNGFTQRQIAQQIAGVKASLAPMERLRDDMRAAAANVASQPADAAGTLPGMTISAPSAEAIRKAAEKAAREAARIAKEAWDKAVKEFAKGVVERGNALQTRAQGMAAAMIERADILEAGFGFPTKEQIRDGIREIGLEVEAAIRNDPFLAAKRAFEQRAKELARHIQESFTRNVGDAIANSITAAFSGKGVINAIKSFGAGILSAIGDFAIQLGTSMIVFGTLLAAFVKHVQGFDGFGAVAAGVGLIAAGAAIKALAASFGGGASSAGGGGGGGVSTSPSFLSFGVQASTPPTTSLAAPTAKPNYSFTIIGPADPVAQRAIGDIVSRADRRGLIQWAPG